MSSPLKSKTNGCLQETINLESDVYQIIEPEEDFDLEISKSVPLTPSKSKFEHNAETSPSPKVPQTPRRSTRKSVKPVQEYEDIVGRKRQLRSAKKLEEEKNKESDEEPIKWTPAKVGRVSQKRSRKSRRTLRVDKNKTKIASSSENEDSNAQNEISNAQYAGTCAESRSEERDEDIVPIEDQPEENMEDKKQFAVETDSKEKQEDKKYQTVEHNIIDLTKTYSNIELQSEEPKNVQNEGSNAQNERTNAEIRSVERDEDIVPMEDLLDENMEDKKKSAIETDSKDKQENKEHQTVEHNIVALTETYSNNEFQFEKRKNVTFYSPANQTTILEDLDLRIIESVKKDGSTKAKGTFVTQRRKRSMSFDEATMLKKSKSPGQTFGKMRSTPNAKPSRTKLPNFAAIHQKNFNKMENLVDHVNRKAERAKVLTNSSTKIRIASAQKPAQCSSIVSNDEKSKAVKCLSFPNSANTTFFEKMNNLTSQMVPDATRKLPISQIAVLKPMSSTDTSIKENQELKLPNPRLGIIKPQIVTKSKSKNSQLTPAKVVKPILARQPLRPAFNLSTALDSHQVNKSVTVARTIGMPAATNGTVTAPAPKISCAEKMASRRQRHMDMFKAGNVGTTPGAAKKAYIRGVRSNRRFELQMAHRKNMEH